MRFSRGMMRVWLMLVGVLPCAAGAAAGDYDIRVVPAITDDHILPGDRPADFTPLNQLHAVAAPDQFEPVSFVIYADKPLRDLRFEVEPLADSDGEALEDAVIDIRIVKRWWQRNVGGHSDPFDPRMRRLTPELLVYDDSLVKVEQDINFLRLANDEYVDISKPGLKRKTEKPLPKDFAVQDAAGLQPLSLEQGENRQFWVTVYTPQSAPAGDYRAVLKLYAGDELLQELPLTLEVLPITLLPPRIDYAFYYRGKLDRRRPDGSVSSEYKSEAQLLADFRNLRAHGVTNPFVYQKLDSGMLQKALEIRSEAGIDSSRMITNAVNISTSRERDGASVVKAEIGQVVELAESFGINEVYFLARDEARGQELQKQFRFWDMVREAGGKVAAAGWRADGKRRGNFELSGGQEDIYICNGMLSAKEAANWHSKGKLIYSYQNPTGGRHLPATWRRNYGLLMWQADYDGTAPYAWQHSYASGWNDFDHYRHKDINFTYPAVDGPIDTLQWEGFREGVDDMRYLATLLDLLESPQGKKSVHAAEVRNWLDELRAASLGQLDLANVRDVMAGYILALQGTVAEEGELRLTAQPAVAPLESDGRARMTWGTSLRTDARVTMRQADKEALPDVVSGARRLSHAVDLPALNPNTRYRYSVLSATGSDGEPVSYSGEFFSSDKLQILPAGLNREGDQWVAEGQLDSRYRASVGLDWDESLLGWWRFPAGDDWERDDSGNEREAEFEGNVRPVSGRFGAGVMLDGDGSYVYGDDVDLPENGTGTIEGWFRFREFAMDALKRIAIFSNIYQHPSNNHLYIFTTNDQFEAAALLKEDVWHHIALTWDGGTASALLYVDGQQLEPKINGGAEEIPSVSGLNIGRSSGFLGSFIQRSMLTFNGDVDEVRVWNRVLSPAEISASYNANSSQLRFAYPASSGASGKPSARWFGTNAADQVVEP